MMKPASRTRAVLALATVAAGMTAATASATTPPVSVTGSVLSPACAEPSARDYDPATNRFECDALERLDGDWSGSGHLHAVGTVDPISGDASGRFTDVLDITLSDGTAATIRLTGTMSVDGATGEETLRARLDRGTGSLRGARGTLVLTGFSAVTGGPAFGNYQGRWHR